MNSLLNNSKNRRVSIVVAYLLSAVSGVIGLLNWVMLRELLMSFITNSTISRWSWQAIDQFGFLLLGMFWLSFVLFVQHYYVKGAEALKLWSRFSVMTGIQALLLFSCHLLPLLTGIIRDAYQLLLVACTEGIIGSGLLWLGVYLSRRENKRDHGKELL